MDARFTFTKRIDVVNPRSGGDPDSPVLRENYFSRNMRLETVKGTERVIDQLLPQKATGLWRYYSEETGVESPKTIAYTIDGSLWHIDERNKTKHIIKTSLVQNAYPKATIFKLGEQYYFYLVDGESLLEWDGNASYIFYDRTPKQADDTSYKPIDIIEHLDRIVLLTARQALISENLKPTVFNSASDSIELIVGSGKGINRALGKINDRLYFFNTEGAFVLNGDVLSAVASTFSVDSVDPNTRINIGNSLENVENGILYLGVDNELYSFNGQSSELLSYTEQLKRSINPQDTFLEKCVAHYDRVDKRYFLSYVETGETENNMEVVYDTIENKIDIIRGRNVTCYCQYDGSREPNELLLGNSKVWSVFYANRGKNFDGVGIRRRLRTRDNYFNKGYRGRITAFYPEIEPSGNLDIDIRYLLDGRLSDVPNIHDVDLNFSSYSGTGGVTPPVDSRGGYFTCRKTGSLSSIYCYSAALFGATSAFISVYSGPENGTLTLLGSSSTISLPTSATWNEFTFSTPISVTAGTSYFICIKKPAGGVTATIYYTKHDWGRGAYYNSGAPTNKTLMEYRTEYLFYSPEYFYSRYYLENARFDQSLAGEQKGLGFINISNQSQFTDRVKPKIDYAQGSSIAFEIDEAEKDLSYNLLGIGIDVISKGKIKGKGVGQ